MRKNLLKSPILSSLVCFIFAIFIATLVYAGVGVSTSGTRVGPTDNLDFYGPAVSTSGSDTLIDTRSHTGDLTVSQDIYTDRSVFADGNLYVDSYLYLTGDNGYDGSGAAIILSQPDGGCSECRVDAGGTSFTCVDITCPAHM